MKVEAGVIAHRDSVTNYLDNKLDVAASYPHGESVFNISKETTSKELISIEGVSEYTRRMQGINLCAGHTNAVEFCTGMFKMPTLDELLEGFIEDNSLIINNIELGATKLINAGIAKDDDLAKAVSAIFDEYENEDN